MGLLSRIKTWASGETLTASDLNAEFDNILNNLDPDSVEDASTDATAMQATADPYPGGAASLATSLRGELQRIRYILKQLTGESQWYIDPDTDMSLLNLLWPYAMYRPKFTFNGGATAYTIIASPGIYDVNGKIARWNSSLTTDAVGSPVADTHYYLYLDYSAITSGTEITNSEMIWSGTAPTFSSTLGGWYNGDDRCIFSMMSNSGPDNLITFRHNGGRFISLEEERDEGTVTPSDSWTSVDVASSVPAFSILIAVNFLLTYSNLYGTTVSHRPGSGGGDGHRFHVVRYPTQVASVDKVTLSDSQVFEVKFSAGNTNTVKSYVKGYYLPAGM